MGPDGATYSFSIASASDVSVQFFSGAPTTAAGLPLTSSVLTITSGGVRLNLLSGPNPPPDTSVLKGTANVPVLQFTLYNRDPDNITVTVIKVPGASSPQQGGHPTPLRLPKVTKPSRRRWWHRWLGSIHHE